LLPGPICSRLSNAYETLNLFTERVEEAKVVEQVRAAISKATGR
jgi:hypothetical protein